MPDAKREAKASIPSLSPVRLAIARYRTAATAAYQASSLSDTDRRLRSNHASVVEAEQAARIMRQRLEAVTETPSGSVQDVLLKLQLWREITGVDDMLPFDLAPPEQTVVSACDDLERLISDPEEAV